MNSRFLPILFLAAISFLAFTVVKPYHFDQVEHVLGQLEINDSREVIFTITNDSEELLVIKNVKASCGCTATGYSTEPVSPGESTKIKATFHARSSGAFRKTIQVFTNLKDEPDQLVLTGEVIARD